MEQNSMNGSPNSPSKALIEAKDYDLQFPTWSMEYLKKAAEELRLVRPRSLAWGVLLNAIPPPSGDILMSIRGHRNFYEDLRKKLSMDPRAVIGDDPLSQNDESAWKQHFCDNELKALILQDVVRTFPEEVYFRDKDVQNLMVIFAWTFDTECPTTDTRLPQATLLYERYSVKLIRKVRVLFFWARSHPSPGYRQGMHEILAPLLYELYTDRKFRPLDLSDTLRYYLQDDYLEHDSYMLFGAIMKGLEKFYSTGDVVPTSSGRLPTSKSVHSQNEVVRYLNRVREEYLVAYDPELASHLAECNISMELFGIRWLRLLFGREFHRHEIPNLWGFIFSDGPMLPNVHYVILAMLLPIRNILLDADTGAALSTLMRSSSVSVRYVCLFALHLRAPHLYAKPPAPDVVEHVIETPTRTHTLSRSCTGSSSSSVASGVAEGGDVAHSLAALALLRARLPPAAAALRAALPAPPPAARAALHEILQLAALLQCRNHALIDVETALEAAENQSIETVGKRQLLPVVMLSKSKQTNNQNIVKKVKEVPLKVFHEFECDGTGDLPLLDPLRLRTE